MSSGIHVDESVKTKYQEMKTRHTCSYLILKISSDKVVIDEIGGKDKSYDDFCQRMMDAKEKKEGRYAVVDVDVGSGTEKGAGKLAFIMWTHEDIGVKQKMLYTSTKGNVSRTLEGIKEIECHEEEDLAQAEVASKLIPKHKK